MSDKIIVIKNLKKSYKEVNALRGISLEVRRGQIFGLLGPNGAGKTTTIGILLGLLRPDSGSVMLFDQEVFYSNTKQLQKLKEKIGVLLETLGLYEPMTVYEYLMFYARLYGLLESTAKERVCEMVEIFGLSEKKGTPIGKLSKGMKQRVAIARALIHNPKLLILDEPSTSLDPVWQRCLREQLIKAKANGPTIFMCSHNLTEVERICDYVAIMGHGVIKAQGELKELLNAFEKQITIEFETVSDLKKAEILLKSSNFRVVSKQRNSLVVAGRNLKLHQLLEILYTNGVKVHDTKEHFVTLEDAYWSVVSNE